MSTQAGLPLERTTLAWWRMALSVLGVGALTVHAAPALVLLFAAVASGVVGCAVVRGRGRDVHAPSAPPVAVVQASALLLSIAGLGALMLLL